MNNIYVGNRYVPVFANPVEWDNLRAYEALTIVTYLGSSYTSKKAVPIGTPLSNTDYWVVTGNFNAQVENYRQEVVGYAEDVNNYKNETNNKIVEIEGDILTNTNEITKIDNKINKKRFVFLGDSFNTGYPNESTTTNWVTLAMSSLGVPISDYFNFGNNGGGLIHTGTEGTYLQNLNSHASLVTEPSTITDVVVTFAYNDLSESYIPNITTAGNTLVDRIKVLFPKCKISMGCIGSLNTLESAQKILLPKLIENLTAIRGCGFYRNCEYIFSNKNATLVQGGHPTQLGHELLSHYMCSCINTGGCNVKYSNRELTTSSVVGTTTLHGIVSVDNATTSISILDGSVTYTTPRDFNFFGVNTMGVKFSSDLLKRIDINLVLGGVYAQATSVIMRWYADDSHTSTVAGQVPCTILLVGDEIAIITQGGIQNTVTKDVLFSVNRLFKIEIAGIGAFVVPTISC